MLICSPASVMLWQEIVVVLGSRREPSPQPAMQPQG